MANIKKKYTKSEMLALFIVNNWHFCPVDIYIKEEDCDGWKTEKCMQCICKHSNELVGSKN